MTQLDEFKKGLLKVVLFALLSLFAIPTTALFFAKHAEAGLDADYLTFVKAKIDGDKTVSPEQKANATKFFEANPPSSVCNNDSADVASFRDRVCEPYSELWQYSRVEVISRWTLIAGSVVLVAIFALGAIAFANRRSQYVSFILGWNLVRAASAAEVLVQGALLVWLSYWVTAFFFHQYFPKLILIAGLLAGGAAFTAIVGIFKRPPRNTSIDGELIERQDAPALWAHVEERANRLETAPPKHIVAGIDTNFFVTESPLRVRAKTLTGRSLFVSLPLLRILDRREADAVLAHELAHFSGGDTASSAALGPKLVQYDHYCHLLRHGGSTIAVFHLVYLYRVIFEFALRRDSREREFRADKIAAKLESPHAIVGSLIKVAAYANYRSQVERKLFEHGNRHDDSLGIAGKVAAGLAPYATSTNFTDSMKTANVPHPFDSHPPMTERMQNVGLKVEEKDYGWIVTRAPKSSWVTDIQTADAIEQKLWGAYEQQFAAQHEMSLAYRYVPSNETERAIVLKYFPPVEFELRGRKKIVVTIEGLELPGEGELLSWDDVANLKYTDGIGGDVLQIIRSERGMLGAKTTKVKLPGIKKQRNEFKQTLARYLQRHRVAREQAKS